jgi:hypothetical protein
MLQGTADIEELGRRAPFVTIDPGKSIHLGNVQWLQFTYEIPGDRQSLLPPTLTPTTPSILTLQLWRAAGGDLGEFGLAQARVSCRAGMRIRTFLLQSVIDGQRAADALKSNFGYRSTAGAVSILQRSDKISAHVLSDGRCVAEGELTGLRSLEPGALQHIENMQLANTADGLKLIQVEPEITTNSLLRGQPSLSTFDSEFWQIPGRMLKSPVIGASAQTQMTLMPIRYIQALQGKPLARPEAVAP